MLRTFLTCLLCGAVALAGLNAVTAQDKEESDYRRLFRKPETVLEFWNSLRFELDVGRADLAARYLHGLMDKKPTEADLLSIIDKDGLVAILRLRNIPVWSTVKKDQDQAVKEVETLIAAATAAQKKRLGDPARIRAFIALLEATPEEKAYALRELYKSGSYAVPILIDSLINAKEAEHRLPLLQALAQMGAAATAPLTAALSCGNARAEIDMLNILRAKHAAYSKEIIPFLWYPSASKTELPEVRKRATEVLSDFLNLPASRLMPAKVALTREAERYYNHEVTFGNKGAVTIWRWDNKTKSLVSGWPGSPTVTASQAEEYYGLLFAREALDLDPGYRPAQIVMLSLAIEKAVDRGGLGTPLSKSSASVAELLATSSPELVIDVLDRAMKENRTGVVLEAVRSLGARAERTAKRPTVRGEPSLVRALYYPDPRVQLAAAEALVRIPGPPLPRTAARIVEILSRDLTPVASAGTPQNVLVAVADPDWRTKSRAALVDAGFYPIEAGTGRDAMRALRARAQIQVVLLDSTLPLPGLDQLLGELRSDVDVGRIPILLAAVPESRTSYDTAVRYRQVESRRDELYSMTRRYKARLNAIARDEAAQLKEISKFSSDERATLTAKLQEKFDQERKELNRVEYESFTLLRDIPRLDREMADLTVRYDLESRIRENSLTRFTSPYANIRVVHTSLFTDPAALTSTLTRVLRDSGVALTPTEQKQAAETSIRLLASLALGNPPGYDVRPAAMNILESLRVGKLSPEGQLAAISASSKLRDGPVQATLAGVILDGARPLPVRIAATQALVENFQRFGTLINETQFAPLRTLARQARLDAKLKEQLDVLLGSIRPGDVTTGKQLREYNPAPAAIIPPPPPK